MDLLKAKKLIRRDAQLAEALGYSKGLVSEYLNNKKEVSELFMRKLFEAYPQISELSSLKIDETGTPIYEVSATASQMEHIGQLPEVPSFRANVPGYEDCNFGLYVYGHSMYNTIENGSLILCRKVDKSVILYGEIYLIRTKDYLMVKRIYKDGNKNTILCSSDNTEERKDGSNKRKYEDFELDRDEIIDLYLVKGIIKKTQS